MSTRKTPTARADILQAAGRVILASGVGALTLDAVAREAGVSKGGLLYHFPAKDALITAMVDRLLSEFDRALAAAVAEDGEPEPGRWLRAYIRATVALSEPDSQLTAALIAALAAEPHLLEPVRAHFAAWQRRAEADGVDPARATVVRMAVDGLWFADMFGLAPPGGPQRERLIAALIALTRSSPPQE